MILAIPMKLPSAANLREHWRARQRRAKAQRAAVSMVWRDHSKRAARLVLEATLARGGILVVTFLRVAPRFLDDDNLATAFKNCRDQIAKELGVDDGPTGPIRWRYDQRKPRTPNAAPGIMVIAAEACE